MISTYWCPSRRSCRQYNGLHQLLLRHTNISPEFGILYVTETLTAISILRGRHHPNADDDRINRTTHDVFDKELVET